jgi:hypothetical protein
MAPYIHIERENLHFLIEPVLRDPNVINLTMRVNEVPMIQQQIVECIICHNSDTRYTEDRKMRPENRGHRLIENIVDVRGYGSDHYLVTTQKTRRSRPYLYGRFEKIFGEFADQEIEDREFRICYKVPKAALSDVFVFDGRLMRGYHVI